MNLFRSALFLICCCAMAHIVAAQSKPGMGDDSAKVSESPVKEKSPASDDLDQKTPPQLFQDADSYARKRFDEFRKLNMPYDEQLKQKIEKEQKELAARYAGRLAARKLAGNDSYYLGMLYNLAGKSDGAYEAMQRFLNENTEASGEVPKNAGAIVIINAAKKGALVEAESRLKQYADNQ